MSLFRRNPDTSMSIEPTESAKGRHRKPKSEKAASRRCGHTWSTRPGGNEARPGAHYDHWCGLMPNHGGKHQCATWTCGETV